MELKTVIFMGRSGCGKGTQASLLVEYLRMKDQEHLTHYLETGKEFRKFITTPGYSAENAKRIYEEGGLMPEFLPVWIWSEFFIRNISGKEHIIMDGVARRFREAEIMDSAFDFYKRPKPTVILIDVSKEWAFDRLMARKRSDDSEEDIRTRLDWFEKDVSKSLSFYKSDPKYDFIVVNGEQTIEEVHGEIISKFSK